jgi:hypothetical protein
MWFDLVTFSQAAICTNLVPDWLGNNKHSINSFNILFYIILRTLSSVESLTTLLYKKYLADQKVLDHFLLP